MQSAWSWIKKHWKWVVFPVGVLGSVLGWFLWWRNRSGEEDSDTTTDAASDQAVRDTQAAHDVKSKELKELELEHGDKLNDMSREQREEYLEVRKKSIDEVAKWIDRL